MGPYQDITHRLSLPRMEGERVQSTRHVSIMNIMWRGVLVLRDVLCELSFVSGCVFVGLDKEGCLRLFKEDGKTWKSFGLKNRFDVIVREKKIWYLSGLLCCPHFIYLLLFILICGDV